MRTAFFKKLERMYADNSDIVVLTGDLGYKLFDEFRAIDQKRFYDVGVAESNMIGLASGLALCGKMVYCYSIVPFLVMRPFEQIRNDVAYHNLDVRLVGAGGGFAYGLEGITHHGLEDIALMRTLQNMTIVAPADRFEAERIAELSFHHQGPMYIRLGHTNEPAVHDHKPDIEIGKASVLLEGKDVALLSYGRTVSICSKAIDLMSGDSIKPSLINMHTIKPLDTEAICEIFKNNDLVLVVEEHISEGGLGSAIAELAADMDYRRKVRMVGIDGTKRYTGRADYLRERHGLSAESLVELIRREIV
jgi:transketolase